jgi:two-component system, sensor histidine kinase and response regulator
VILMLTSESHLAAAPLCRELGVSVFLSKPIGQSELLDAILQVLAVRVVEDNLIATPAPTKSGPEGRSLNILLAEDNHVNQMLAIRLLEKGGHHFVLARTGREALSALEQVSPPGFDVVLMDIQMPEMDGKEATAVIRERERSSGRHLPIIAMTANAMNGDRERYFREGMDGYVSKPVHSRDLFAEIERCLKEFEKETTMAKKPSQLDEQLDRVSAMERLEGDQELFVELIRLFLREVPHQLEAMRKALHQGDMLVLERSAHSLKGAASNLSALGTATAASQLEEDAKGQDAEAAKASLANLEVAIGRLLPVLADLCQEVSK